MSNFVLVLIALFLTSCQSDTPLEGYWNMHLNIQGKEIPFQLNFKEKNHVELVNGPETIPLEYRKDKRNIVIPILSFDARIELERKGELLSGRWVRPNKKPAYNELITGVKADVPMSLPDYPFPFKWRMTLKEKDKTTDAILLFTAKHDGKYASILTPTGDYRFLTPRMEGKTLILTGFDGVFAHYIEGKLDGKDYKGTLYSGKSWNQPFSAKVDEDFELPDPTKATKYKGSLEKLSLPRLGGGTDKLINESNKNKVKVIQIFGSWCPNCIDETRFIRQWRKDHPDKAVDFSIVSFERSPNKKHALKMLQKTKETHGVDYPIFIGGYTREDKVDAVLPGMENFISFPTTIFLDKKNNVRKIHAGFSGPATGKYYEKFVIDFNALIDKLLSE